MYRENTKVIHIGNKVIGGGNPVLIQSMCNTKTENVEAMWVMPDGEQRYSTGFAEYTFDYDAEKINSNS